MTETLERLPLHDRHEALGARFAPFAGFEMPVRYGSIVKEHQAVRNEVGLFDVSHMGEVEFRGPEAGAVVNHIITNNAARLQDGQALYTAMCHPHGGIVDDLLVYRLAEDHYLACVNASNRTKDFEHMREAAAGRCEVINRSDEIVQLAVQGPQAVALVDSLCDEDLTALAPFHSRTVALANVSALVSRTGYTGEDGVEIYYAAESAETIFDAIWEAGQAYGLKPVGLAARDTLRLEARLLLYGNDINDDTTPLQAGIGWTVKFKKGDFIGRDALLAQKAAGLERRLLGLVCTGRGVLRAHYPILSGDHVAGETTSGGPSPTLGGSIALGYVAVPHVDAETLDVEVRGRRLPCSVTMKPFYKRPGG
jgi:aminomethyltransferase